MFEGGAPSSTLSFSAKNVLNQRRWRSIVLSCVPTICSFVVLKGVRRVDGRKVMELRFIAIANFQDSIHQRSFVGAHIVGKSPFGQELFDSLTNA